MTGWTKFQAHEPHPTCPVDTSRTPDLGGRCRHGVQPQPGGRAPLPQCAASYGVPRLSRRHVRNSWLRAQGGAVRGLWAAQGASKYWLMVLTNISVSRECGVFVDTSQRRYVSTLPRSQCPAGTTLSTTTTLPRAWPQLLRRQVADGAPVSRVGASGVGGWLVQHATVPHDRMGPPIPQPRPPSPRTRTARHADHPRCRVHRVRPADVRAVGHQ